MAKASNNAANGWEGVFLEAMTKMALQTVMDNMKHIKQENALPRYIPLTKKVSVLCSSLEWAKPKYEFWFLSILHRLLQVITLEAPFCCFFLDFVQQFAGMLENRPVWQKALLYLM